MQEVVEVNTPVAACTLSGSFLLMHMPLTCMCMGLREHHLYYLKQGWVCIYMKSINGLIIGCNVTLTIYIRDSMLEE